jgi:hypothetical protein
MSMRIMEIDRSSLIADFLDPPENPSAWCGSKREA